MAPMQRNPRGRPRHPDVLTPAEWRVLEQLREGGTNAEIASRLGISGDAVKYHISNMLGKLELRDRHELADWRPDAQRGRLRGFFAIPAALAYVARPIAWVGVGTAAVIGVVVVIVVVQSVAGGEGDQGAVLPTPIPVAADGMSSVDRCATPTDADCVLAVYLGAPGDHAQVADIPRDKLLTPDDDGRYIVRRGQQVTVVTRASLPDGWTRFDLRSSPTETPSPVSFEQLIQPLGTTYTFTVTDDEAGASVITYDLVAARPNPVRPGQRTQLGDVVVTTEFLVPTLRYNLLDTTGAATTPGSYAFLTTAGDTTSAIGNYGALPVTAVELRIHPADASGISRASLYDAIRAGDTFDYRTNGVDCIFRFRVLSVGAGTTPRILGIEHRSHYLGRCIEIVDEPGAPTDTHFVWRVRAGYPDRDGHAALVTDEPAGPGTYSLTIRSPYVIDVPSGMRIALKYRLYTDGGYVVILMDEETGSLIWISEESGNAYKRHIIADTMQVERKVGDLFDELAGTIRLAND